MIELGWRWWKFRWGERWGSATLAVKGAKVVCNKRCRSATKTGDHGFQQLKTSHDSCWGSNHTSVEESHIAVEESGLHSWRVRITFVESSG